VKFFVPADGELPGDGDEASLLEHALSAISAISATAKTIVGTQNFIEPDYPENTPLSPRESPA
jgi:hypothetical protein